MQIDSISSSIGHQKTPSHIEQKILEAGMIPTGNYAQDIQLLHSTMKQGDEEAGKISIDSKGMPPLDRPQKGELPWADLLQDLGLSPQGSKEADLSAIANKISELEAAAKTDTEKANVDGLKSEYQQAVAAAASLQPPAPTMENFAGMQNLGEMNKHFMGI